ncbi:hypothetical protein Sjap_026032 [Stephania japonica]|uniref:DNA glycosylase n=1 Tax=Stephania japonica TaxID=461633 RepID=A0AAP0HII0_9MAGN
MAKALCALQLEMRTNESTDLLKSSSAVISGKRKRNYSTIKEDSEAQVGDFPNFKELAGVDCQILQKRCNLGYRALTIVRLAQKIYKSRGNWLLELEKAEEALLLEGNASAICDNVYDELMSIKGFGSFASSYVLTCMGNYQRIPADTETIRYLNKAKRLVVP